MSRLIAVLEKDNGRDREALFSDQKRKRAVSLSFLRKIWKPRNRRAIRDGLNVALIYSVIYICMCVCMWTRIYVIYILVCVCVFYRSVSAASVCLRDTAKSEVVCMQFIILINQLWHFFFFFTQKLPNSRSL